MTAFANYYSCLATYNYDYVDASYYSFYLVEVDGTNNDQEHKPY